jgi:hypothetical protein
MTIDLVAGSTRWVVMLEGGGWCSTWEECVERKSSVKGTSRFWRGDVPRHVLFASRHFQGFNFVLLKYCDGGSFLGTAGKVTRGADTLYFEGHAIVHELLRHLQSLFGLGRATDVLVTGSSAGGLGAVALTDSIRSFFPRNARYKCAPLAGVFPAWVKKRERKSGCIDFIFFIRGSTRRIWSE